MGPINLSAEVWMIVAAVAGFTVLLCLGVLASTMEYNERLKKLTEEIREKRSWFAMSPARLSPPSPSPKTEEPPSSAAA